MIFKFLEKKRNKKIKAKRRLEDIAIVGRFAERAKILIDYNPRVGYRFLKQMHRIYYERLGGYVFEAEIIEIDKKVSAAMMGYVKRYC